MRSWEIRDVNVLLQELERFSGLCILATNRTTSLDKALERRVAIKVEFEAPGLDARRKIWEKMIPGKMPLARDVDFEELAEANLTGGEIKNVVLNAARNALSRDPNGRVAMEDFRLAVEMERDGRWNKEKRGQIGFAR
jgi:SpoVK/Ycf46/Vps4 family AAA+-type ATPase